MDIYAELDDVIHLAETANDSNYDEKLDVIAAKAKAIKLQLAEDAEAARQFDEFEEPEA